MRPAPRTALTATLLFAHAACVALTACGGADRPSAPSAPGGGGGRVPAGGGSSGRDGSSSSASDDDAGKDPPEKARPTCENVVAADPMEVGLDGTLHNAVSLPMDLSVTRVETAWTTDCAAPALRITLSDGRCPAGDGHEVEFLIDAAAIQHGRIGRGNHLIEAEPLDGGLRIRYRRPREVDPVGEGVWGTCFGATGSVDFMLAPSVDRDTEFRVRFTTTLTPCDDKTEDTREVNGTLDVTIEDGLDDACPEP